VHAQRDEGDHHHHQRAQPIDQKSHLHAHVVAHQPGVDRAVEIRHVIDQQLLEHHAGQYAGDRNRADRDRRGAGASDCLAGKSGQQRRDQRQHRDGKQ
jgi:hypothetical protein